MCHYFHESGHFHARASVQHWPRQAWLDLHVPNPTCNGLVTWHVNEVGLVGMTPSCMSPGEDPLVEETKALSCVAADTLGVRLSCGTISMSLVASGHGLVCNTGPKMPGLGLWRATTCVPPTLTGSRQTCTVSSGLGTSTG
jgi:hypothetical protein